MDSTAAPLRIAALADLHCPATLHPHLQGLLAQAAEQAEVVLLCGDLTDYGLPEEARTLAREIASIRTATLIGVFGNHDLEAGKADEVKAILTDAGVKLLDGDSVEVGGVGFAGCKGFGGGFGQRMLAPWGEEATKRFVHEAIEEALKLERALSRLNTPQRVAVLHYSPVAGTVDGEPLEIYPFLGSSRLEEPLNRYRVAAVFHGHAHRGRLEARTSAGVPVYNVALPLLKRCFPERPAFRLLEIPRVQPIDQRVADRRLPAH